MFAEEDEWDDEPETRTAISSPKPVSSNAKSKGVGKKSLQRTLQTLGSIPDWSKNSAAGEGSDSETEGVPVPSHTKKKRIKKRKRGAAKREEAAKDSGELSKEEPAVAGAKKLKEKPGPTKAKNTESIKEGGKEDANAVSVGGKLVLNTKTLSRKQWKNKTKSNRKCTNKYRQNGECKQVVKPTTTAHQSPAEGQKVNPDGNCEMPVAKPQPLTQKYKQEKEGSGKAWKRKKVQESEGITPTVDTQTPKDEMFTTAGKKMKRGNQASRASLAPSDQEPHQEVNKAQQNDGEDQSPQPSKRRKPEESKQQQRRIEKLRRLLQGQGSDETQGSTEQSPLSEKSTQEEELPADRSSVLRSRMEQRLESARFRYINELLYTTSSGEAKRMFKQDPQAFGIYHRGFTAQAQRWPVNPVDAIISYIRHKPASLVVADFGCGDCKIAHSVKNKVHSFDLAPVCDLVTVCDMANVPLDDATVDIAVFCLSLMGTNLGDFLVEANRVLVMGGVLKIAEVASRFEHERSFMNSLTSLGFKLVTKDIENSHFYSFEFLKTGDAPENVKKSGLELRPCVYKKR